MSTIREEIEKEIRKIIGNLKDEDDLKKVLKVKLTKKEYKIITLKSTEIDDNEIAQKLNMDIDTLNKAKMKLTKKLNQEKLKQELMA
jgi:DNA-binding NarL/FixJ family response regulator